jgi:hypothetical protein
LPNLIDKKINYFTPCSQTNLSITNIIKQGLRVKCDIGLDTIVVGQCPTKTKYLNFFYSTQTIINILITFLTWMKWMKKKKNKTFGIFFKLDAPRRKGIFLEEKEIK